MSTVYLVWSLSCLESLPRMFKYHDALDWECGFNEYYNKKSDIPTRRKVGMVHPYITRLPTANLYT